MKEVLSSCVRYLAENKEWLFSGAFVAFIVLLIQWLFKKRDGQKSNRAQPPPDRASSLVVPASEKDFLEYDPRLRFLKQRAKQEQDEEGPTDLNMVLIPSKIIPKHLQPVFAVFGIAATILLALIVLVLVVLKRC